MKDVGPQSEAGGGSWRATPRRGRPVEFRPFYTRDIEMCDTVIELL